MKHAHMAPRESFWMRYATILGVLVLVAAIAVVVAAALLVLIRTS